MKNFCDYPSFSATPLPQIFDKNPMSFIDIGARDGVHSIVQPFSQFTSVIGFEPDPDECRAIVEALKSTDVQYAKARMEPIGLAGKLGKAVLHRISAATNDSLRRPNKSYVDRYKMLKWREIGESVVDVSTIDHVIFDLNKEDKTAGEFIKIDTQGTELEILRAGERTLEERCVALISEISFCELYVDQGLFSELEQYLRGMGFVFYGFDLFRLRSCNQLNKKTNWSRERMIQADAIFFKDPLENTGSTNRISKRQSSCLIVAAVLLEYFEFAHELACEFFESLEAEMITRWIKEVSELDMNTERDALITASKSVAQDLDNTLLVVGEFVDARRKRNDVAYLRSRENTEKI